MRVTFHFKDSSGDFTIWLMPWYCRPVILRSLCFHINESSIITRKSECLFCTCEKYGCRQFLPKESKQFYVFTLAKKHIADDFDVFYCIFD